MKKVKYYYNECIIIRTSLFQYARTSSNFAPPPQSLSSFGKFYDKKISENNEFVMFIFHWCFQTSVLRILLKLAARFDGQKNRDFLLDEVIDRKKFNKCYQTEVFIVISIDQNWADMMDTCEGRTQSVAFNTRTSQRYRVILSYSVSEMTVYPYRAVIQYMLADGRKNSAFKSPLCDTG